MIADQAFFETAPDGINICYMPISFPLVYTEHMEKPVYVDTEKESPARPTDEIREEHEKLLSRAKQELHQLTPVFKQLIEALQTSEPDVVILLDKGARIFATPLKKILQGVASDDWKPTVVFFNDENLKVNVFLHNAPGISDYTKDFLEAIEGKRTFFIDETISSGRGAYALKQYCEAHEIEFTYFALTNDPNRNQTELDLAREISMVDGISIESASKSLREELEALRQDPQILIGNVNATSLFSKTASELYVTEGGNYFHTPETLPRFSPHFDEEKVEQLFTYNERPPSLGQMFSNEISVDDATDEDDSFNLLDPVAEPYRGTFDPYRSTHSPPGGIASWQEYDQQVHAQNYETLKKLKNMIEEALRNVL